MFLKSGYAKQLEDPGIDGYDMYYSLKFQEVSKCLYLLVVYGFRKLLEFFWEVIQDQTAFDVCMGD